MLLAGQDHRHALAGRNQSEGTVSEVQRENEGWFQIKAPFNSVEPGSVHGCTCREKHQWYEGRIFAAILFINQFSETHNQSMSLR